MRLRFYDTAIALLLSCLMLQGCANILVNRGLAQKRTEKVRQEGFEHNRAVWERLVPGITAWGDSLKMSGVLRDTFIVRGGVRLHACYAAAPESSPGQRKTAVVVHGYRSTPFNVMAIARMYRDSLGFNIFLPTLRHHGHSGGEAVQMGWLDRLDVLDWSALAHGIFSDTLQVFHGVSMGAATVMMASGEETPGYVKGFIEDCGYTSVWNELVYVLNDKAGLRAAPTAYRTERIVRRRYGWDLHEASSLEMLSRCAKPVLFIHGECDRFVPTEMAWYNYNAKISGYREIWIAPGSKHAMSFPDHTAEYVSRVRAFIAGHVE